MEYRPFGATDLHPSVIGFGCSRIASFHNLQTQQENLSLIHTAMDMGINFFDTADSYGFGDSERLLGKAVKGVRDKLIICSKAGYHFGPVQRIARWVKPLAKRILGKVPATQGPALLVRNQASRQNFSPDHIKGAIEGSLRRLGTDYLDLFLLHSPPSNVLKDGEIFETLENLKDKGMLRYFGVSCAMSGDALDCINHSSVSALQMAVNPLENSTLQKWLPLAIEKRIPIIARQPFAGGTVFAHPPFLDVVKKNSTRTIAQTALKFVEQLDGVGVILPGMSSLQHLYENCNVLSVPSLSAMEMQYLNLWVEQTSEEN
ncbi:MAG TPA: aldo/keto reductase [Cyclobacteriaceae bacterium]|nr:aldo/keto reductase [Cyclobacteriaceae bacterium]